MGCLNALKKVANPAEGQLEFENVGIWLLNVIRKCSLLDPDALDRLFQKHGPFEAVIHFAAFKHVGESQRKGLEYYENNLVGSINLMKAMRKSNCKRLSRSFAELIMGSLLVLLYSLRRCRMSV